MSADQNSAKVIEVVGHSQESWEDAAQEALDDASETLDGISGIEVVEETADVEEGEIVNYRSTVHISFPIQR